MSIWRLVYSEIRFRKLSFLVSVAAVAIASGWLTGELTLLATHDRRTEEILAAKEKETAEGMAKFEDETRKLMLQLGFNIRILPKGVNLSDFYGKDYAAKHMPEEYAERLTK